MMPCVVQSIGFREEYSKFPHGDGGIQFMDMVLVIDLCVINYKHKRYVFNRKRVDVPTMMSYYAIVCLGIIYFVC